MWKAQSVGGSTTNPQRCPYHSAQNLWTRFLTAHKRDSVGVIKLRILLFCAPDYPSRHNVITRVLMSERGKQQGHNQRDFRGPQPMSTNSLDKLDRQGVDWDLERQKEPTLQMPWFLPVFTLWNWLQNSVLQNYNIIISCCLKPL